MAREFVESKRQTWGFNIFPQGKFLEIRRASLNVLIEPADRVKVSDPWVGKISWRRERLPTPVFWPREFHGLYSQWGHRVGHNWVTFTLLHLTTSQFTIIMPLEFHGLNLLNYSFNNIFTEQLSHAIVFKVGKTTPKKQRHRLFPVELVC